MNQLMLFDQRSLLVHDSRDSAHSKSFDSLYCGMRCVKVASGSRERSTHTLTLHSCSFMTFMFFGLQHVSIGFAFARLWRHSDSRGLQTTTSNNVYSIYIYIIYIYIYIFIYIYIYIYLIYIYIYRYSCNVFMPSNQTYFKFGLSVAQAPTVGCWCNSRYCRLFAVFVILFAMGHLAQLGSAEDVGQWPSCRIIRCPPAAFDISTQIRHILIEKDYKLYIYIS